MIISKNLIIGAGQVGLALSNIFTECDLVDKKIIIPMKNPEFMHIAFPWRGSFVKEVVKYAKRHQPEIIIIHSTVQVGTTRKINEMVSCEVVYSPIIGQHDCLGESIKTFNKLFAGFNTDAIIKVAKYFKKAGLKPLHLKEPEELELGKLLATTRYALNIAFAQEQERICNRFALDYSKVVLEFEKIFNEGTLKMKQIQLVRPFIYSGVIEGHCLMPNIKILKLIYNSEFFNLIEKSNDRKNEGN